jgi:hypothetical protein
LREQPHPWSKLISPKPFPPKIASPKKVIFLLKKSGIHITEKLTITKINLTSAATAHPE